MISLCSQRLDPIPALVLKIGDSKNLKEFGPLAAPRKVIDFSLPRPIPS